jgi:apolipoprotein N-acyltransferase
VGVALLSAAAAFVTVGIALRLRVQGKPAGLWILSTLILTSPLALLLGPLG